MTKFTIGFILILIVAVQSRKKARRDDLPVEIESAKHRLRSDYIEKLWLSANEKIAVSHYNMLKLYTQGTIEQAQQVVDYLTTTSNVTLTETARKTQQAISSKQKLSTVECAILNEINTVKAYKTTGYNLHNCIRSAQIATENKHLEIVRNFENIKQTSLRLYDHYNKNVDNCVDSNCVMTMLIQSVIRYEKLQEELAGNVTEVHNLSSRYLLSNIAMTCVAQSINQIHENYKIGKGLVNDCFLDKNNTVINVTTTPKQ